MKWDDRSPPLVPVPDVVRVPGPARSPFGRQRHEQTSAVHVLVLGEIYGDGERDALIEHPPSCPSFCTWMPAVELAPGEVDPAGWFSEIRGEVRHDCLVAWELEGNSFDGLADEYGRDWYRLATTLAAGRYLVSCWYHDGYGAGESGGQGDPDGTFDFLGPETPLALTYPPNLLNPHVHFTTCRWRLR